VQKILDRGYAYVSNGSVYMDVEKYAKDFPYGKLSGRNLNDIVTETRELDGQAEKKHSYDFALWKKAAPEHIMHWPSPWSEGFPGWHMECSTMGTKYLGEQFDIHGGGLDLIFPHHEAEIAQSCAALGHESVHYWMHNNMITIAGKKMGKSYNNFITLEQFFSGEHPLLSKPFGPMVIRFFILQAHYRSTVDFSSEALEAAEKGLQRMQEAYARLLKIQPSQTTSNDLQTISNLRNRCSEAMDDDLNTPNAYAVIFDTVKKLNTALRQREINFAQAGLYRNSVEKMLNVLGITVEKVVLSEEDRELFREWNAAKKEKDFAKADVFRAKLMEKGLA
jgi:cysteinyl-tRNA synthetase